MKLNSGFTPEEVKRMLATIADEYNEATWALEYIAQLEDKNETFRDECLKLKKHLGPDGEYCITRADKESMSWESLVVSDIFEKLDSLLADKSE